MVDLNRLSNVALERLKNMYQIVRKIVISDEHSYNNWVKATYFDDVEKGFPDFVENIAIATQQGDISWYEEDEVIVEWCCRSLRIADFIHRPEQ